MFKIFKEGDMCSEGNNSHRQTIDFFKMNKNRDESPILMEKNRSSMSLHKIEEKLSTDALLEKKYCRYFPKDFFNNQDNTSNLNTSEDNANVESRLSHKENGKLEAMTNMLFNRHNSNCAVKTPIK